MFWRLDKFNLFLGMLVTIKAKDMRMIEELGRILFTHDFIDFRNDLEGAANQTRLNYMFALSDKLDLGWGGSENFTTVAGRVLDVAIWEAIEADDCQ
jgi:hypothetical protein